jgi:hypothetical protein
MGSLIKDLLLKFNDGYLGLVGLWRFYITFNFCFNWSNGSSNSMQKSMHDVLYDSFRSILSIGCSRWKYDRSSKDQSCHIIYKSGNFRFSNLGHCKHLCNANLLRILNRCFHIFWSGITYNFRYLWNSLVLRFYRLFKLRWGWYHRRTW